MPVIADEHELLCRLADGDRNAFDGIYWLYFQAVYRNAVKITRDPVAAEDILQEVFITLWEKKESIHVEQSVGGWLFVLCYNKSVNLLRKKLRESSTHRQLQEPSAADDIDETKYNLQWQLLENAMTHLSPQKRKVFELCKIQGKTYEETASVLQLSKYTVKEYLSSSVSFLKEYVQQHPESTIAVSTGFIGFMVANA